MRHHTTMGFSRKWTIGAIAACLLAGCGADQVAGIQGSGTPAPASVTVVGPITGFGSIFVDGVEYATSGAQIRIDDQPAAESQLRTGQIVTLKGTVNADGTTGTATQVSFSDDLRGPVSLVDIAGGTVTLLGQSVRITNATIFGDGILPAQLSGLQVGAVVEISGFSDANGELVASRIDLTSGNAASLQVRGTVQSLDTTAHTFLINALTVDYSAVVPSGTLANGSVVTVQGSTLTASGALIATRVQVSGGLGAAANDSGRIEGVVTNFVSTTDFTVNGQRVTTDANTQFTQGSVVALNAYVNVQGTFNSSGVLVANRVEVRPQTLSIVRGLVESVSAGTNALSILGVSITTSSTTSFDDKSDLHLRSFRLTDVRTGDYVEARGVPGATGGLTATLIERDRPDTRSYLEGTVTSVANPNFTALGVTVATDSQTVFVGVNSSQGSGATQFFAQALNHTVRVRGTLTGNVLLADQVQLEQ